MAAATCAAGDESRSRPACRVLVVTNLWPTEQNPAYGAMVQAQMESLRTHGVEYEVLFVDGRRSLWNYVRAVSEVRRCVRRQRYDLVHAHFGLSGWVARCQCRVPLVVSFMGDDVLGRRDRRGRVTLVGRLFQASSFVLSRLAAAVIVKSVAMQAKLALDQAEVIPNGVDLDLFRPLPQSEARSHLHLDPRKKLVLFPYDPQIANKRYDLIEEAVARARQAVPNIEVLQVNRVPHREMPLYLNAADLLVLASHSEGSPNIVKEAMAVGLPVVSVDVGDVREAVGMTEGCFIVPRDAAAMAEKMVEVCRRGTRTLGRERVSQRFSSAQAAARICQVYARVLARRNSKSSS